MAFPSSPSNGQIVTRFGRKYQYNQDTGQWRGVQAVATTTIADIVDEAYIAARITDSGTGVTTYSTLAELPLADNTAGAQAFVAENNRLYIWNGSGWYNIALINTAPSITSGGDASYELATDGTPIEITLVASDPEGIPITWSYSVTSGILGSIATISQADNVFTITPSTDTENAGEFSITFTASDGVNLATSVSSFTLVFGVADQYYTNTSLLVKTGSTAGLNNNTFVDESTNSHTVTPTGDVRQGSFSPYPPVGWSNFLDGVGDYMDVGVTSNISMSGDWTIEVWAYCTNQNGGIIIDSRPNATNGFYPQISISSATQIGFYYNASGNVIDVSGGTIDRWVHIAFVKNGNTITGYFDGVSVWSVSDSNTWVIPTSRPRIGANGGFFSAAQNYFPGYIADLRVVNGTALYTSNFSIPPDRLTAVSGTEILTCQSARLVDNSTNRYTITKYGDVVAKQFPPVVPDQYNPTVHSGSAYFDGSGDYLTIPYNANITEWWTEDFTLEAWVYPTTLTGWWYSVSGGDIPTCISHGTATSNTDYWSFGPISNGTVKFYYYNGSSIHDMYSTETVQLNSWNHIAFIKNSSGVKIFVNGVGTGYIAVQGTPQSNASNLFNIGAVNSYYINGNVSDVRIVKGTAVYTADFTPPTQSLTAVSGTSLLLNMSNAGIYDEISKSNIQVIGNATTSTTQTKYSDTSMYFDGTGDYLILPSSTEYSMGSGDYTVEGWFYFNALPPGGSQWKLLFALRDASNEGIALYMDESPARLEPYTGSQKASGSTNFSTGQWYHIAVVRNNGTIFGYVNGNQDFSYAYSTSVGDVTPYIAGNGSQDMNGYVEDFRITKGVARYTGNFTPPTAPLGFSNAE